VNREPLFAAYDGYRRHGADIEQQVVSVHYLSTRVRKTFTAKDAKDAKEEQNQGRLRNFHTAGDSWE
jgi:hypothetical protein